MGHLINSHRSCATKNSAELSVIMTNSKSLTDFAKGKTDGPEGHYVGVIVSTSDWLNKKYAGIFGRAVYINPDKLAITYIRDTDKADCLLVKGMEGLSCVGKINGNIVRWVVSK
jgi:hypothetical protein